MTGSGEEGKWSPETSPPQFQGQQKEAWRQLTTWATPTPGDKSTIHSLSSSCCYFSRTTIAYPFHLWKRDPNVDSVGSWRCSGPPPARSLVRRPGWSYIYPSVPNSHSWGLLIQKSPRCLCHDHHEQWLCFTPKTHTFSPNIGSRAEPPSLRSQTALSSLFCPLSKSRTSR